jgi:transposase
LGHDPCGLANVLRLWFSFFVVWRRHDMAGISPVTATQEQTTALKVLARGPDRAEADRARALLLTLKGWTSARIAQAFGVREDTVRLWRSDFSRGGVDALRARIAPGPSPVKAEAALRVAVPLLSAPVEDRRNRTLSRLEGEIARREGLSISRSQLSKVLRKKGGSASGGHGTR